jgi:ubiquinone/menaquinone biosynthesis C-methylase UbiE
MAKKEEIVKIGYDKIAQDYQANRGVHDHRKELEEFVNLLPKNAKVLDVGCGAGIPATRFLVESGFDVTGVDFSESMLGFARRNVPEARFIKEDMTELGFKDNSFDGLTACESIIHVPREKHSLLFQSFHRIIKPNGAMLISIGSSDWEATDEFYGARMFWSHYRPEKSLQMIKDAGFKIVFGKQIVSGKEKYYWVLAKNAKTS